MNKKESESSNFKKFITVERKPISSAGADLVKIGYLRSDQTLPLVLRPNMDEVDLVSWSQTNRDFIETELLKHGAILFRDFGISSANAFEQFAITLASKLSNYVEGSSPRLTVGAGVYTSTEYPPEYFISLHNELSYAHQWPSKLFFYCAKAAQKGGETPLARSQRLLELLDTDIQERFEQKGVKYTRNLHGEQGLGLSWQAVFETTSRSAVEEYCRSGSILFRWKENGGLWTSQRRPAFRTHPTTGERVWFNQVDQWHPSNLGEEMSNALLATTREEDLPINAYYGDGTQLEKSVLDEIRGAYREATVTFTWQEGDILLIDNMLVAHGRMPFIGPRKVLVAMGAPVS